MQMENSSKQRSPVARSTLVGAVALLLLTNAGAASAQSTKPAPATEQSSAAPTSDRQPDLLNDGQSRLQDLEREIDSFRASNACDGPEEREVRLALIEFELMIGRYPLYPAPGAYFRFMVEDFISQNLAFADAALEMRCLDLADETYRGVIATYTGTLWSSARQRAQIGVDDVRAARGRSARR